MSAMPRGRKGFTIVEMLVVIAIISLLIAVLLPAVNRARSQARKTEEGNNIRQVGIAWANYANNNNDAALPGFLDEEVQSDDGGWDVSYRFPDKTLVPADDAEEWPWRLLSYLNYNNDVVRGYLRESQTSPMAMMDRSEEIAEHPAFGYNAYYIGGWWTVRMEQGTPVPRPRFAVVTPIDETGEPIVGSTGKPVRTNVLVSSPSAIVDTEHLMLFCSSTEAEPGEYHRVDDLRLGAHYVAAPYLAEDQQWKRAVHGQTETRFSIEVVAEDTAIPAARYTSQAVALHGDLHWAPHSPGELTDMRYWINKAGYWVDETNHDQFRHTEQ